MNRTDPHASRPDELRAPRWTRRFGVLLAIVAIGFALAIAFDLGAASKAVANSVPPLHLRPATGLQPISFRDRLIVGLQARIESEVEFVDYVVFLVNTGRVPQRLVDQTFFWARGRAARVQQGRPRRAIIYFRPAMTMRLQRLGIDIK